ncbi:hypothetical protein ACWKWU_04930 [Chitinophaga lutea]
MKKLFVFALAAGLFAACNNSSTPSTDSTTVDSSALNAAPVVDSVAAPADSAVVADSAAVAAPADSAHKH